MKGTKRPHRLTELPLKADKNVDLQTSITHSKQRERQSVFSGSEMIGNLTPKNLGYPTEDQHKKRPKRRNFVSEDFSFLKVGGQGYPTGFSTLQREDPSATGPDYSTEGNEKLDVIIKVPYDFTDSSSEDSKEFKLPALPNITSSNQIPKTKSFGRKEASKLITNLNLIDGRKKNFPGAKQSDTNLFKAEDELDKISKIQLETQVSLPKITIDEVLKSWDVQPSRSTWMKRSSSNAWKYDPMEFLTQRQTELDKGLMADNLSSCYDGVKGCRYLRTGKKEEEEMFHGRKCPCNSCEHGEGLKESPYLNA